MNLLDTAESNGGSLQSLSSSYIMQSGLLSVSYSPNRTNCLDEICKPWNKQRTIRVTIFTSCPNHVCWCRQHNAQQLKRSDHLLEPNQNTYFTYASYEWHMLNRITYVRATASPRIQLLPFVVIPKECDPRVVINRCHISTNNLHLKFCSN